MSPVVARNRPFHSTYNVGQLPSLVRTVASYVDPGDPLLVTQRRFDAARSGAGHPTAPTARQICARLDRGWREVLELAFVQNSPDRSLGRQEGERPELLDAVAIAAALRAVLGAAAGPAAPDDYERTRARMLRSDRRRRHGGRLSLPTAAQISLAAGGWNEALALVGLDPRQLGGRTQAPGRLLDQIERYLKAEGALPGKRELGRWLTAQGDSMPRPKQPWSKCLSDLRRRRGSKGLWTPARATRHGIPGRPRKGGGRRRPAAEPAAGSAGVRRRVGPVTEQRCRTAMAEFLAWLPSSQRPTLRAYREFCRQHPGTPWPSSFAQFGGWGHCRDQIANS